MNRRDFLKTSGFALASIMAPSIALGNESSAYKPLVGKPINKMDLFSGPTHFNDIIIAPSGSGKSFYAQKQMFDVIMSNTNSKYFLKITEGASDAMALLQKS